MEIDQESWKSGERSQIPKLNHEEPVFEEEAFDTERLKIFYQHVFPCELFFKWLSYDKLIKRNENTLKSLDDKDLQSDYFYKREFSFTLANDIYCRYLSFKSADDFRKQLVDRVPHKIDIGAVFNMTPSMHLTAPDKSSFKPEEKEMVFDIDMDAYDDIRQCCSGAKICQKCWEFPNLAAKVIDRIMLEDFDFKCCLWVFSGRRGVHCWVCDPEARSMNNEMRNAVANFINLNIGGENSGKLKLTYPLHPHLQKAYEILEKEFYKLVIVEQNILTVEKHRTKFLSFLKQDDSQAVIKKWNILQDKNSIEYWKKWQEVVTKLQDRTQIMHVLVFSYLYPRIDLHVSTATNHLLKSPFCVHPKTGNICIPFDPNHEDSLILEKVPTLTVAIKQLGRTQDKVQAIDCLRDSIKLFKRHITNCVTRQKEADNKGKERMQIDY